MRSLATKTQLLTASLAVGFGSLPSVQGQEASLPPVPAVGPQPDAPGRFGEWVENDERLNRQLLNSLLVDGNAGVPYQPRVLAPLHERVTAAYTNGINTPLDILNSTSQQLADRIRLPIIPVYNESGVGRNQDWTRRNLKGPIEDFLGPVFPTPGLLPIDPATSLRERMGGFVGRAFDGADSTTGIFEDLFDASGGRFVSPRFNSERATDTLLLLMKGTVENGKTFLLLGHSQGAINAADATRRYQEELNDRVKKGEITRVQASTYLANIAVLTAGSPMPTDRFANGVRVITNRNPGDPVAKLSFEEPIDWSKLALEEHGFDRYIQAVSADAQELMAQLAQPVNQTSNTRLANEAEQIRKDLSVLRTPELKALRERLLEYSRNIASGESTLNKQAALTAATDELLHQLETQDPDTALKTASAVERIMRLVGNPSPTSDSPSSGISPEEKTASGEAGGVENQVEIYLTPEQTERLLAIVTARSGATQEELVKKGRELERGEISAKDFAAYAETAGKTLETSAQTASAVAQIVGYFDPDTARTIDRVALGLEGGANLAFGIARVCGGDFTGIGGIASGVANIFSSIFGGGDHGPSIEELIYQRQGTIIANQKIILQAITQNADLIRMVSRQVEELAGNIDNEFEALKDNLNDLRAGINRDLGALDVRIHRIHVDLYREIVEQARFRNRFERLERRSSVLELPVLAAEAGLNLPDYRTALRLSFNDRTIDPGTGNLVPLESYEKLRSDLIDHVVEYSGRGFFSGSGFNVEDVIQYGGRSQGPWDDRLIVERFGSLSDLLGPKGLSLILAPPPEAHVNWISGLPANLHNPQEVLDAGSALVALLRGSPDRMMLNTEDLEPILPIIDSILLTEDYVRTPALAEVSLAAYETSWARIKAHLEAALTREEHPLSAPVQPGHEAEAIDLLASHHMAPTEINSPVVSHGDQRTRADIQIEADRIPNEAKSLLAMGVAHISASMSADGKMFNANFKGRHLVLTTNVSIVIDQNRLNELDPTGALAKLLPETIPLYRRSFDEGRFLPDGAAAPEFANGSAYVSNYSTFPCLDLESYKKDGLWGRGPSTGNWVPPYWSYDYDRHPGGLRSPAHFNAAWKGTDIPTLLNTLLNESWTAEEGAREATVSGAYKVVDDKVILEARKNSGDQYRRLAKTIPLQDFFLEKSILADLYPRHYGERMTQLARALVVNPKILDELRGNAPAEAIRELRAAFAGERSNGQTQQGPQVDSVNLRATLMNLNLFAEGVQTGLELNALSGSKLVEQGTLSWSGEQGSVAPFVLPVAQDVLRDVATEEELRARIQEIDAEIMKARTFIKRITPVGFASASVQALGERGGLILIRLDDGNAWSPNTPKQSGSLGLFPRGKLFIELENLRGQLDQLIGKEPKVGGEYR